MLSIITGSVDERLVSRKMADAERPAAVCLIRGHCGPSGETPIFSGLTEECFSFPLFVLPWGFCAEFLVETDLLMWSATKKSLFIHSPAKVPHETSAEGLTGGAWVWVDWFIWFLWFIRLALFN